METRLLSEQAVFPSKEILENALGASYSAYNEFIETISTEKFNLVTEWRFYKDGSSWLCKVSYKKTTVLWISVWSGFFKVGFYFSEKTRLGIQELDIDNQIKIEFNQSKNIGKLFPLEVNVSSKRQIEDLLKIIAYKKKLK